MTPAPEFSLRCRPATEADAAGVADVLSALVRAGLRRKASDPGRALEHYIANPARIRCTVAEETGGRILGFQSLKRAGPGNPYDTPVGWGIVGTHIDPAAARRGIGRMLFAETLAAARAAGLPAIEAYIGVRNAQGRAYYKAMGFRTYRTPEGIDAKVFEIPSG